MKFIKWKRITLSFKIFIYTRSGNGIIIIQLVASRNKEGFHFFLLATVLAKQTILLIRPSLLFCSILYSVPISLSVLFSLELYFILQAFHFNGLAWLVGSGSLPSISQGQLVSFLFHFNFHFIHIFIMIIAG